MERIAATFSVRYSLEGVRKLLRRLGFRHISPRPLHPRADLAAQEDFRRNFSQLAATAADGAGPIEIWFQDEARAGQQGMLSRVWARKGTRPRIPRDRRFGYCYLFSAACAERKHAVGHICSRANTVEMNRHLGDISATVEPGSHAVAVLDGAGWHKSRDLDIPANLSLLHLPPYSPELNQMENVFEYLKSNHFANRVFKLVEDVCIGVKMAWLEFENDPDLINSITARKWAAAEDVNQKSSMINWLHSYYYQQNNGLQNPYRNTKSAFCVFNVILGTNLPMTPPAPNGAPAPRCTGPPSRGAGRRSACPCV